MDITHMENLKAELQSEIAQWVGMGNQVDIILLFLIIGRLLLENSSNSESVN